MPTSSASASLAIAGATALSAIAAVATIAHPTVTIASLVALGDDYNAIRTRGTPPQR
jgi:hypothetical protein